MDRNKLIVRTSIIGIIANIFLASFKAFVGILANSISVILDAVNNLSDALSSIVTIIGTKLAGRTPDKKHPLGHGRIEYLSTMIVAAIVFYAGITSFAASVRKIIKPADPDYTHITLIVIASAIAVKLVLGRYVKKMGEKLNSGSLVASGSDALFDAIISLSVLVSAIIFMTTGIALEAFVGVIISLFIMKSGIEMFSEAVSEMLGKRVDRAFLSEIRKTISESENVYGVYDLILHSYGPERYIGSVHVEIPDTMKASEIDAMERKIAIDVYKKHGVMLGGIGIYTFNTENKVIEKLRNEITHKAVNFKGIIQIHGFYYDSESNTVNFDVIVDFDVKNRREVYESFCATMKEEYPDYNFNIALDLDI
ncbi:MAG: cation transporter [Lachnospiraceae bacterium]|nr:cation transporter [Lachnospiraceae bacterium]